MHTADYNEAILVDTWSLDQTYDGFFPKGAREKTVYFTPENPHPPFLKANHRHLFKKSSHRYPWQFWMEIIAYRIGLIMDVSVPPAYVAVSDKEGGNDGPVCGALIEWFYGTHETYVDGGRFMSVWIPDFDSHKGAQHNLQTILESNLFKNTVQYWAKVLVFDTIIGNVDRHQDNWGGIFSKAKQDDISNRTEIKGRMSPAFDNGTALSYEILEPNFKKFADPAYTLRYLTNPNKAKHHMRWSLEEPDDVNFFQFMGRFLKQFPDERGCIEQILGFTRDELEDRLFGLTRIETPEFYRLTPQRLEFTIDMIMKRKELMEKAIAIH